MRKREKLFCESETRTKQSFKDEVDVNNIVSRYKKTGLLPSVGAGGRYGDFSGLDDYQSVMNKMLSVQELFMRLPAKVRSEFKNDVGGFLAFIDDPNNLSKAVEMGLVEPKQPEPEKTPTEGVK